MNFYTPNPNGIVFDENGNIAYINMNIMCKMSDVTKMLQQNSKHDICNIK